jgi:hypothetical protein
MDLWQKMRIILKGAHISAYVGSSPGGNERGAGKPDARGIRNPGCFGYFVISVAKPGRKRSCRKSDHHLSDA